MNLNKTNLHPKLIEKCEQLYNLCLVQGINISWAEGYRTIERQNELYAQGRTKPGYIVTNAPGISYSSQHQWGIAQDFYLDMDIDGDGDKKDDAYNNINMTFEIVGAQALSLGLGWGGTWTSFQDLPHLYLPDWGSSTSKLKQEFGTPEKFMQIWDKYYTDPDESFTTTQMQSSNLVYKTQTEFIKDIQKCTGSKVDGIAGKETIGNTITVSASINRRHPVIEPIQRFFLTKSYPVGTIDGIAGVKFTACINKYQKEVLGYKNLDGEITKGKKMWQSLLGMI